MIYFIFYFFVVVNLQKKIEDSCKNIRCFSKHYSFSKRQNVIERGILIEKYYSKVLYSQNLFWRGSAENFPEQPFFLGQGEAGIPVDHDIIMIILLSYCLHFLLYWQSQMSAFCKFNI